MHKLRIINAMFGKGLGGIEQALIDYSQALQMAGHESIAVIHPDAAAKAELQGASLPFYEIRNFGGWDLLATVRIRELLNRLRPDAIIAHGKRAVTLFRRAAGKKYPVIAVTHNYKINCDGVSAVFSPTKDLQRHAETNCVTKGSIYLVPNMVRVPAALSEHKWHKPPVIGTMGRFVAKKGFLVLIEALSILHHKNIPFRAVIAGEGEQNAILHTYAESKGLGDVIHFPGWVQNKQAFWNDIDVFCLPSHHEPFGIVLLEAMAQGVPVVSTMSEGPSEILTGGHNGLLVDKANARALAASLETLLNDAELRNRLAQNAYETVKTMYDMPAIAARIDANLRAIVSQAGVKRRLHGGDAPL